MKKIISLSLIILGIVLPLLIAIYYNLFVIYFILLFVLIGLPLLLIGLLLRSNKILYQSQSYWKKGAIISIIILMLFVIAWSIYLILFAKDSDARAMTIFTAPYIALAIFALLIVPFSVIGGIIGLLVSAKKKRK